MSDRMSELASPPRKGRTQPLGLSDEAPSLIEKEQVDVERAIPIEGNEPAASKYVTTTWLNDHECVAPTQMEVLPSASLEGGSSYDALVTRRGST